jgi:hypothetical protein
MSSLLRPRCRPSHRAATALQLACLALVSTIALNLSARAGSGAKENVPSPQDLTDLEQRASQAAPREQAFLYTELVHEMTEQAGQEISNGETEQAAATLKQVNRYAHLIHLQLAHDTKRLKNAEMIMHNTTYRLGQFLHLVNGDDKKTVQDTLAQLDQVNDEILTQVFQH